MIPLKSSSQLNRSLPNQPVATMATDEKPGTKTQQRKEAALVNLPLELLEFIFQYLDNTELRRCLCVCKLFHGILDPKSTSAQYCWVGLRQRLGLPDPSAFDLSETAFLKKLFVFRSLCDFCNVKDGIYPIWQLHGYRICPTCFPEVTIPKRCLNRTLHERQYIYLPTFTDQQRLYPQYSNTGRITEYDYQHCLRDDIINDRIPDDKEVRRLKEKFDKLQLALLKMRPIQTNFGKVLRDFKLEKTQRYKSNVYKWLIYKNPNLNLEMLSGFPELTAELEKQTSLDSVTGRMRLEEVTLKSISENFEQCLLSQFKHVLPISDRPSNEIHDWKNYDAFWKDGLLTRTVLPTTEEILQEMEKHASGLEQQVQQKVQAVKMMITHAHELPFDYMKPIMETDAFQNGEEDRFAKICKSYLLMHQRKEARLILKKKNEHESIKVPSLVRELRKDPIYIAAKNETAFAQHVASIKAKQVEFEERVKHHIRIECANDVFYNSTMAAAEPSSTYMEYLVSKKLEEEGAASKDPSSASPAAQEHMFECCNCDKRYSSYDSMFKHILFHDEDIKTIRVSRGWLQLLRLFSVWNNRTHNFLSTFSSDEQLFIVRHFSNWVETEEAFLAFERHVAISSDFIYRHRESFMEAAKCIQEHCPSLFSSDCKEALKKLINEYTKTAASNSNKDLVVVKARTEITVSECRKSLLARLTPSLHNVKFFSKLLEDDFDYCWSKVEKRNDMNFSELASRLETLAKKLEDKWKAVDTHFQKSPLDELMNTPYYNVFLILFKESYGEDTVIDRNKWVIKLKSAFSLRNSFVEKVKWKLINACNIPADLVKGNESKKIFIWKPSDVWVKCSLIELVSYYDLVLARKNDRSSFWVFGVNHKRDLGECGFVGMQNLLNDPNVLKK